MFKNLGLKGRVLVLSLLPSSLMALALGSYFGWMQMNELEQQLLQRGRILAEQLAPLAAPALASGDATRIGLIARQALEQPDTRSVSFISTRHGILGSAGPSMLNSLPTADGNHLAVRSNQDASRFLLPVFEHHRSLQPPLSGDDDGELLGWVELELSHHATLLRGYQRLGAGLLLILVGLLGTALLALRLSRTVSTPLIEIKRGVALLKEGRLETRLPPLGSQEMDEVASGINRMAEALQYAQEELQHSVEQATEDVRQNLETIEIQNIELDFARKEALEASRIKSEFLANMSHEIRTPLNGILGFTRLLQKSALNARQQDYLNTIEKSADSLLGIINEVLDFSKIEAGKLVFERIPFNLYEMIQETIILMAPNAHAKQLELVSLIYRDTPQSLIGDPQRLKQILTNLVSNAIKFTHEGTIAVRAMIEDDKPDHAQIRISVQDTGIGLADGDIRHLFQAFNQADNSMTRQAGGTGLGLTISKRLIEQMGGEIGVSSDLGLGSEFWISLSLPKAHDDCRALSPSCLLDHRVALLEQNELTRQALAHQLEDLGLEVQSFDCFDTLHELVSGQDPEEPSIRFCVAGASTRQLPPEQLSQHIWDLAHFGCKTLVLCPTTEQTLYQDLMPGQISQVRAKPACPQQIRQSLLQLLDARLVPETVEPPKIDTPPRLLCVDDNPANLLLVKTLLEDMGASVHAVDNGHAALASVQGERFDLVFMDVQMPGMDGRQTTEAIRHWEAQQEGRPPLPIIALTAHALSSEKRALLQIGMDDYMSKPINERQLAQMVLKWTGLALQPATEPPAPQNAVQIPVLDMEEGLRLAAGKPELANDMLDMLLKGLPDDALAIRQAHAESNTAALIERVHRLHGASRYCGVPQLRAACQRCETLLKQDAPGVDQALEELEAAIARLSDEIRLDAG